jgi:hypothetical protein
MNNIQNKNDPNTPSNMPNIKGTVKGKKSPDNKQEPAQTCFKWENLEQSPAESWE